MPALDILIDLLPEILFDHGDLAVGLLRVGIVLQVREHLREQVERVVFGVGDQEGQIDEVVRVGEIVQVGEEHRQVGFGVSEWCTHQHPLFTLPPPRGASGLREVVVANRFQL